MLDKASESEPQAGTDTPSKCDEDVVIQEYPQTFLSYEREDTLTSAKRTSTSGDRQEVSVAGSSANCNYLGR